ncbi:hypothetical protein [Microvirga mediterraneensis]|jgi:hypothetical protein|uniref:DUF2946 domain-containing protein n=1 Tax=Microvirga mediterraneensis TaxID=2754695 RepID=A0A838BUY6_9HYPH|nr:hypothetical protein [Microvirga mediterraneensis]MBA1158859.1 hypothetical protein [Microvirga mediterraneensis]
MKPWLAITRLLGILAILGLVFASFTVPAVAGGLVAPMATADTEVARASSAYDMARTEVPCCAPTRPSKSDGPKACPLAALCHAKILQGISTAGAVVRWFSPAHALIPRDDATLHTLAQTPPSRPPQA